MTANILHEKIDQLRKNDTSNEGENNLLASKEVSESISPHPPYKSQENRNNLDMIKGIGNEAKSSYTRLLFDNRPFRLYLCSYLITITGEWLTYVASIELIEHLLASKSENSRRYISFLVVCRLLPHFILIPFSGTLADARDRRISMIVLDLMAAIAPPLYLLASYFKSIQIVFMVTLLQAGIAAMYEPCRTSILPLMVTEDEYMKKATTLTGLGWSAMTAIGSGMGGLLVARVGVKACFMLDSISFLFSALLLYCIGGNWDISNENNLQNLTIFGKIEDMAVNGMKYVMNSTFWPIIFIKFTTCLTFGGFDTLNVSFAEENPGSTETEQSQMLGALFFGVGFGCLIGPLIAEPFTSISKPNSLLNACVLSFVLQAAGDFAMGYSTSFNAKVVASVIRGSGSSIAWIDSQVLLQVLVKPDMLGRVAAIDVGLGLAAEAFSAVITGFLLDDFGFTARYVCTATGFAAVILFAMWLCYSVFASETALRTTFSYATVKISKENVNDQITERSQLLA